MLIVIPEGLFSILGSRFCFQRDENQKKKINNVVSCITTYIVITIQSSTHQPLPL